METPTAKAQLNVVALIARKNISRVRKIIKVLRFVPEKSELQGHTKPATHVKIKNVKSQKDNQSITALGEI